MDKKDTINFWRSRSGAKKLFSLRQRTEAYDKAKWHFDSVQDENLSQKQAYVFGGLLLGWLVEHQLVSPVFHEDYSDSIDQLKTRKQSPSALYQRIDGVLDADILTDQGNQFLTWYWKHYLADYETSFSGSDGWEFRVEDTWSNFDLLSKLISERYQAWQSSPD